MIGLSTYPGAESSGRLGFDEPRVQIVVRGTTDESTARLSADAIYGQLHGAGVFALTGGVIVNNLLGLQGGPIYVGVDDNNRHLYSINFRVEHRNMTTHRTL